MLPGFARTSLVLAIAGASFACSATLKQTPAPPSHVERGLTVRAPEQVVWPMGEELRARAELLGVHVGDLVVRLGPFCDEPKTHRVESSFDTVGVARLFKRSEGRAVTWLNPRRLHPSVMRLDAFDGDTRRNYELRFDKGGFRFDFDSSEGERKRGRQRAIEGRFYDFHSAFLLLRSWRPEPGEQTYFHLALGRSPWRADVTFLGREEVEYRGEKIGALHLKGTIHRVDLRPGAEYTPREFHVWFSDDERRLPVRVTGEGSVGSFGLVLEEQRVRAGCFEAEEK